MNYKARLRKLTLVFALAFSCLAVSACNEAEATAKFVDSTNRTARYTEDFIKVVDEAKNQKLLDVRQALAAIESARKVNSVNGQLVNEAARYVITNEDGTRELKFTADGKTDVVRLASSVRDLGIGLVNDPVINSLPADARARINLITAGLSAAVVSSYTIATKIKPKK